MRETNCGRTRRPDCYSKADGQMVLFHDYVCPTCVVWFELFPVGVAVLRGNITETGTSRAATETATLAAVRLFISTSAVHRHSPASRLRCLRRSATYTGGYDVARSAAPTPELDAGPRIRQSGCPDEDRREHQTRTPCATQACPWRMGNRAIGFHPLTLRSFMAPNSSPVMNVVRERCLERQGCEDDRQRATTR